MSICPPASQTLQSEVDPLCDCLWVIPFLLSMISSEKRPVRWKVLYQELLGKFFLFPRVSDNDSLPLSLDPLVHRGVHRGEPYLFSHVSDTGARSHQHGGRGFKLGATECSTLMILYLSISNYDSFFILLYVYSRFSFICLKKHLTKPSNNFLNQKVHTSFNWCYLKSESLLGKSQRAVRI